MERMKIDGKHALAFGAGTLFGTLLGGGVGYLAAKRLVERKANWRMAAETEAQRAHFARRLAEANASLKSDHPLHREPAVGDGAERAGDAGVLGEGSNDDTDLDQDTPGASRGTLDRGGPRPGRNYAAAYKERNPGIRSGAGSGDAAGAGDGGLRDQVPVRPDAVVARRNAFADEKQLSEDAGIQHPEHEDDDDRPNFEVIEPPAGSTEAPVIRDRRPIVFISMQEFLEEEELPYSKVSLTYYEADGVVADERDEVVSQPGGLAGDFASHFGRDEGDPNVIYVRNNRLKIDMEITKMEVSYAQHVAGYGEPE